MGYAFIGYNAKHQSAADALRKLFNTNGIDTWTAPFDIPGDSRYSGAVNRAIEGCCCFVMLIGKDSVTCEAQGLDKARALKKPIVTAEIEKMIAYGRFSFSGHDRQIRALPEIDENSEKVKLVLKLVKIHLLSGKESDIESDFRKLGEKYPEESVFLEKYTNIFNGLPDSVFVNNYDFRKVREFKFCFEMHFKQNIISVDMQDFIEELVSLLHERKGTDEFINKYRSCGLLVLDDFQFCFFKEATQELLYRILKYREENGLPTVIFSCTEVKDYSSAVIACLLNVINSYEWLEGNTAEADNAPENAD